MNCKKCNAELEAGVLVCPECGTNQAETAASAEVKTAKKEPVMVPLKMVLAMAAVIMLAVVFAVVIFGGLNKQAVDTPVDTTPSIQETVPATTPADTGLNDASCKGSYTVTDEEAIAAMDTVVATAGDYELTNAELQVYYWLEVQSFLQQYGSYAMYFGLDYTQPLDTQVCGIVEGRTWQQFFLSNAIGTWRNYRSMAAEAELAAFQMDEKATNYLATLEESMNESALSYGFADAKEMMVYNVGAGAEIEDYVKYMTDYYLGYQYYTGLCKEFDTSDAALEAYFQEHEAEATENGITKEDKYVDVRHVLIMPENDSTDADGNAVASEESWAKAQMKAQDILNQYLAGDKTEESFGALANEHTADGNDVNGDGIPDGGLYTDVYKGQMVPEFEAWCFEDARVAGDTGLVKTTYGWHIMYFVGSRPVWKDFAEEQLTMELANKLVEEMVAKYPLTVDYSAVKLGLVNMGA